MRHAVITGAGQGIGKAIARELANQGLQLTLMGRDLAKLEACRATLAEPSRHRCVTLDVSDPGSVTAAFDQARVDLGPITILVNNAGQAQSAPALKTTPALWQHMLDVNLSGSFWCAQAALPDMLAARWGRIVQVASTAGQKGYAYVTAYVAAKHGVVGMTRALAVELASKGITVNAVCPGFTETELLHDSIRKIMTQTGRDEAQVRRELVQHNPQARMIQPEEVASAVGWLVQDQAASITGQCWSIAGGEVMS